MDGCRPADLTRDRIPFERALDFANKEKITELLYPLFVHNIGSLLYHPTNQNRTNVVMAAAERRKAEQSQLRSSQAPGLPSISSHHHHSMQGSMGSGSQHAMTPNGRPDIQRAHTFPTPPTSASSVMNMAQSDSFQWGGQTMGNVQGATPLAIDTGLSNTRSMPTTPATTPPGTSVQNMQQYQHTPQSYDSSRQMYAAAPVQQNAYPQPGTGQDVMNRYGQANAYVKNEMGPPGGRATDGVVDPNDPKSSNGLGHNNQGGQHDHGDEEAEHEHDAEYTHDNQNAYDASRPYTYAPAPSAERSHLAQDLNGSPTHQAGSGRATPRTTGPPQPYYQQGGYNTPPQALPPSSNLYNVMSSERGTAHGDGYASQGDMATSMSNGYSASAMNGLANGKRGRDDDDEHPDVRGGDLDGLKRRKTIRENSVPSTYDATGGRARAPIAQRRR